MAFLDHRGESEFPFSKDVVFNAMVNTIPTIKGMKLDSADKLQGRIVVKGKVSMMSWGENIPIQLSEITENRTRVSITSSPKTGALFGGAFDLGKNRKNIERILSATSSYLSNPDNLSADAPQFTQLKKKWYDNKFITHLLLIIFFPVGLFALWKSRTIAKWWKVVATIIVGVIVFNMCGSSGSGSSSSTSSNQDTEFTQAQKDSIAKVEREQLIDERERLTIKAPSLVAAYVSNEVAADKNYKGKEFFVEGVIDDIGKDILNDIYITLKSEEALRSVQCLIDDEDVVSDLRKGQKVTIYGKCNGLMMNVIMKDCKLVKNKEDL